MKYFGIIRLYFLVAWLFIFFNNRSTASIDSLLHSIEEQISNGHIDSALYFADKALVTLQHANNWKGHRRVLRRIKKMPYSIENAQLVSDFYTTVAVRLRQNHEGQSELIWSYIGDYYARNSVFEKAVPYYKRSASGLQLLNDTSTLYLVYYRLGQALIQGFSDGVQANKYADAAIRVYAKKKRQTQRFHGKLLGLKGWAHRAIDENKALDFYKQAITTGGDEDGRFREQICRILINQQRFLEALSKANTLEEAEYGNPEKHALLAQALTGLMRFDEAVEELQRAQKIYESWGSTKDPEYIKLFYFEAVAHQKANRLQVCIEKCQMVYQLSLNDFESVDAHSFPSPEDGPLSLWIYNALLEHGKTLRKLYSSTKKEKYLTTATRLFDLVLQEVESRRWQLPSGTSKEVFNKFVSTAYDEALLTQSTLEGINHDHQSQNNYLKLYDRSKSTIFRETILKKEHSKNQLALKEQRLEDSLQSNIAMLRIDLARTMKMEDGEDERKEINSRLFHYEEALKVFNEKYKPIDPKDKYFTSITKKQLRAALGDDVALFAYHLTSNEIIQLFVSPQEFNISKYPLTDELSERISLFRKGLTDWNLILDSTAVSEKLIDVHGASISNLLLNSIKIPDQIGHLIIVPDRTLHHFPFELLSYEGGYLGEQYQVSYAHTLGGTINLFKNDEAEFSSNFGGFAPTYGDHCNNARSADDLDNLSTVLRSSFEDLPEARENVTFLADLLNGHAWLGKFATKKQFIKSMSAYSILHLGMHGQIDSLSNELSNLVFGCGPDNILHLGEIQSYDLSTKLVVLSACNTGVGNFASGDGPMSLSKSFFYAGAQSTLMSLWPVPDKQTAMIMRSFYTYLSDGLSKSQALQKAKLDYLQQASALERHPAFWSGFVLFGDDAAIHFDVGLSLIHYLFIGFCLLGVSYLLFRRYNKNSRVN